MFTLKGIIVGAVGGLLVTALVTFFLPAKLRAVRPLLGALLGVGAAYLLMRLIK